MSSIVNVSSCAMLLLLISTFITTSNLDAFCLVNRFGIKAAVLKLSKWDFLGTNRFCFNFEISPVSASVVFDGHPQYVPCFSPANKVVSIQSCA